MSSSNAEDIKRHTKVYLTVGVTLLVLTVVTVGASYAPFVVPLAVTVALIIAIAKGSLVLISPHVPQIPLSILLCLIVGQMMLPFPSGHVDMAWMDEGDPSGRGHFSQGGISRTTMSSAPKPLLSEIPSVSSGSSGSDPDGSGIEPSRPQGGTRWRFSSTTPLSASPTTGSVGSPREHHRPCHASMSAPVG